MKGGFFSRFGPYGTGGEPGPRCIAAGGSRGGRGRECGQAVRGIARNAQSRARRKSAISLRVDPEVLSWFKAQGPGYQTRMNAVLRAYKDASS